MTHTINIAKAGKSVEVNFDSLPAVSQTYFLEYGMRQSLNDATASLQRKDYSTDVAFQSAAMAMVQKRLDGILKGELRQSAGRIGDPVEAEAIRVAVSIISNAILAKGGKLKDYTMKDLRERAGQLLDRKPQIRLDAAATVAAKAAAGADVDLEGII